MEKSIGIRIKWLGCAGFEMNFGGFTVVTDPFMDSRWLAETPMQAERAGADCGIRADMVEHCDAIAVTHGHYDHITEVPALQKRFGCPVLCGELTAAPLMRFADLSPMDLRLMSPNLELDFGAVKIKALFGVHTRIADSYQAAQRKAEVSPFVSLHPEWKELYEIGNSEYRNFLFTAQDGTKLLHWGCPLYPELKNIIRAENPDILILQIIGSGNATTPEQVLSLIDGLKVKHIVANHLDFPQPCAKKYEIAETLAAFFKEHRPDITFSIPQYGAWMEF